MNRKFDGLLIVDDDEEVRLALHMLLKDRFHTIRATGTPRDLPLLLAEQRVDLVLLDLNFTPGTTDGAEGLTWLERIFTFDPDLPVIVITAYGDVETAVRAMRMGATDFIQKPWRNEKLLATVNAALRYRLSRLEVRRLRQRQRRLSEDMEQLFQHIIAASEAMHQVLQTAYKVAPTNANVLILGETGTGKELLARAIHRASPRAEEVFLSVDLGALAETLFESELFGHVKGAFTDAREDRPGRFEIASGGTLFLDEIGNLPPPLQAKLLTVLEKHEVTRLGANTPIPVDIRLICATNLPIHALVEEGRFRRDLLYRINTVEIHIPPLRERPEDIPPLVEYFVRYYARKHHREFLRVSEGAMARLRGYAWPGNVRELQNVIERAVIMSEGRELDLDRMAFPTAARAAAGLGEESLNLADVEKKTIARALAKHRGNITRAARDLGISRGALYRKMAKYGMG